MDVVVVVVYWCVVFFNRSAHCTTLVSAHFALKNIGAGGGGISKVQFFKFFALNIYFYGKTTLQFVIEEQAVKDAVVHYHCFYHCHLRLEHFLIMESRLLLVSCFLVSQLLLNPPRAV